MGSVSTRIAGTMLFSCLWGGAVAAEKPISAFATKPAIERPANGTECVDLAQRIEESEKEIARQLAVGVGDNSAPREHVRLLERLSEQEFQSQQLTMMVALKCPNLPTASFTRGRRYFPQALRCQKALATMAGDAAELCDKRKWTATDAVEPTAK